MLTRYDKLEILIGSGLVVDLSSFHLAQRVCSAIAVLGVPFLDLSVGVSLFLDVKYTGHLAQLSYFWQNEMHLV